MRIRAYPTRVLAAVLAASLVCQPLGVMGAPYDPTDPQPDPNPSTIPWPNFSPPQTLVPPLPPIVAAPGATAYLEGGGGVTPTGDYEYSIPIRVPVGRADMQPNLAFHYSSRRRDHLLGVGWSISGLSVIHRCATSFFVDGRADGVDFDGGDPEMGGAPLCLDGKKLVNVGGEYRTEREEFVKVTGSVTGANGFTMLRKDGTIAEYKPKGLTWPITSVRDRDNNEIRYTYSPDAPNNITEIQYTTRYGDVAAGPYKVIFNYQARSFPIGGHVAGEKSDQPYQLQQIAISGPNGAAWTYTPGYVRSVVTRRLLLDNVQLCAYGSCTQRRIFEYDGAPPAWQLKEQLEEPALVRGSTVQVLDFDGNGKDDILYAAGKVRVMRNSGLGSTNGNPPPNEFININAFFDEYSVPVDVDGDGKHEVVAYDDTNKRWRLYRYVNSAFDFVEDATFPVVSLSPAPCGGICYSEVKVKLRERPYFVDLDGDGLPEMVKHVLKGTWQGDVAATRVWANVNGTFSGAQDYENDYFPKPQSLYETPPFDFANYPARLVVGVDDRYGDHRQTLVQRAYTYAGGEYVEHDNLLRHDDDGDLEVWVSDAAYSDNSALDLDGDGLRERLYFIGDSPAEPANAIENVVAWTRTNTGVEHVDGPKVAIDGTYANADEMEWLVGDLDEDGKEDLVMAPRETTIVDPYVKLAFPTEENATINGDALQRLRAQALPLQMPTTFGTYRTRAVRIGDFDADGRADLLVVLARCNPDEHEVACDAGSEGSYFQIYTRTGASPDQLVKVRDDGAARVREELTWMQWRKPNKGGMADTCAYPAQCINRGFPVVREHRFLNPALPAPKLDRVSYLYDAPRAHIAGRGFLGFGIVRAWYPERPMEVTTTYLTQYPEGGVYPYATSPGLETTVVPILTVPPSGRGPGQPTSATARVIQRGLWYDWKYTAGAANTTRFRYSDTKEWEEDVSIDWNDVYEDHIFNIGPAPEAGLRRRKRWVDWDDLGNVTFQTAETIGGVKSQVENVYQYPSGQWPVALLKTQYIRSAKTQFTAWKTRQTNFHYYATFKLRTVVTEPTGTPQLKQYTLFDRDPVTGLVRWVRRQADAEQDRWTFYQYDSTGAHVVFEGNNLKHATWRKVWPELGVTTVAMDANGASISYLHDGFGRLQKSMPEGGATTDHDYILQGSSGSYGGIVHQWTSQTNAVGHSATDDVGRPIEQCGTFFSLHYSCAYTDYDALGNARSVTTPGEEDIGGVPTKTTFDSLGRAQDRRVGDLGAATFVHGFSYTIAVEPNGSAHYILRDKDDRVVQSTDYPTTTTSVPTTYTYAEFDNVERVDVAGQNMSVSTYDTLGRLTGITDADMGASGYGYNGFGEMTVQVFADWNGRNFKYDAAGRVYEIYNSGTTPTTDTIEWDKALNGIGRVSKTTSSNTEGTIVTKHDYDSLGRPWKNTWTIDGTQSFLFTTNRDSYGRVNQVEYPAVSGWPTLRAETTFGPYGHPEVITARFLSTNTTQKLWEVKNRELDGSLKRGVLGNLIETNRTYDGAGRLATQKWTGSLASMDMDYDYDDSGNVTSRIDLATGRKETFQYDGLSRLRHWWLTDGTSGVQNLDTEYTYDDLGNLKKVYRASILKDNNTYGAQGKPHALGNDGFGSSFTYDVRGRMITAPSRTFTYTQSDLPKTIGTSTGTATLRYDALQDRVLKTFGTTTTLTVADLYERKTTGSSTRHTFRVPGTDGLAAEIIYDSTLGSQPVIRYLSGDRNGSVTLVTNQNGSVFERHYFDPFGKRTGSSDNNIPAAFQSQIGWGEHPHDDDLGLIDMTGRVYDPRRRRFLTPDPIVPNPLSGQAYNRYSFGFNNPVTLNDPDGHDPTGPDYPAGLFGWGPFSIFVYFSSWDPDSGTGSASGSSLPRGAGWGGGSLAPAAPPPQVRENIEQYAAGWYQARDSAPGCQQSKGGTAARECVGPGDQGCITPAKDLSDIGEYGANGYNRANQRVETEEYEHGMSILERTARGTKRALSVCNEDFCPDPNGVVAEAAEVFINMLPAMVGEAPPGSLTSGMARTRSRASAVPARRHYTEREIRTVLRRQSYTCNGPGCGARIGRRTVRMDHIHPHAQGHTYSRPDRINDLDNIQGLCEPCNAAKSDLDIEDAGELLWQLNVSDEWVDKL